MKQGGSRVQSELSRFTSKVVSLAKKAVGGNDEPLVQKGEGGYADWVIVGLHGLREYLDYPYRRLMGVFREMPETVAEFNLMVAEMLGPRNNFRLTLLSLNLLSVNLSETIFEI